MPASQSNHGKAAATATRIDKLDYRPLRSASPPPLSPSPRPSHDDGSTAPSVFEQVASAIVERDRSRLQRDVVRWLSFGWAVVNCLCAGSITAYSLYAPLFQHRLGYSQLQVNAVSMVAELAMYLPVSLFGYLCDRTGPGIPSLLSGLWFGAGYGLAALTYRSGPPAADGGWPLAVMILAFVCVGMGTSCMYLSAVTTCAKNFGRGNAKGVALAVPIAAFGLSGMWQSQVGSRLLYERAPDGSRGDVDVFRFFLFLAMTLCGAGIVGSVVLKVVDEGERIEEAVEELERNGLLVPDDVHRGGSSHGYGTLDAPDVSHSAFSERSHGRSQDVRRKKAWVLNEETRRYLGDHTMWWLAGGFFLVTGPGEAFLNNFGTILGTLTHPSSSSSPSASTATHVSIVALSSTVARLLTGTLTDMLAPPAIPTALPAPHDHKPRLGMRHVPRPVFLLCSALLLSLGQVLLASGAMQDHAPRFAAVSALIGAGYGAVFSLAPILVSVVWGVDNFGTNWGILAMAPAGGAAVWGAIYAAVYQWAAARSEAAGPGGREGSGSKSALCYGTACYAPTFWAMAVGVWVACGMWIWAWKGPRGWTRRGIAV